MREIKFRGKRIDNGEWVYGSLLISKEKGSLEPLHYYICPLESNGTFRVAPGTIGQYTGLKDKNETEICEGDILLCKCNIFGDIFSKVVSNKGCYMVLEPGYEFELLLNEVNEDSVIAGNVFENPELLEGAEQ